MYYRSPATTQLHRETLSNQMTGYTQVMLGAHLVQSIVPQYQPVAVVVEVGEGNLVLAVTENSQLPLSCRLQKAREKQVIPAAALG